MKEFDDPFQLFQQVFGRQQQPQGQFFQVYPGMSSGGFAFEVFEQDPFVQMFGAFPVGGPPPPVCLLAAVRFAGARSQL